uniref:Uncharacterized protein n=1 Tax=Pristionchus pacificus TaxID=54126 RepID=A0A2A6BZW2_PRIPA|eukprot:PDM71367.1 hypothetical protein PRIPAC_37774 [Pristionchus pacificus]
MIRSRSNYNLKYTWLLVAIVAIWNGIRMSVSSIFLESFYHRYENARQSLGSIHEYDQTWTIACLTTVHVEETKVNE